MVKKNKRPTQKKHSIWERIGGWWLWIIVLAFATLRGIQTEIKISQLAAYGIQTKGFIYSRNHRLHFYRFYYPSWEYERHGVCGGRVGDSIDVIFLPENPDKNYPWETVKNKRKAKERITSGELHP